MFKNDEKVRKINQNGQKCQFWAFLRPNYGKIRLFKAIKMIKLGVRNDKLSETFILPSNSPLYVTRLTKNSQKSTKIFFFRHFRLKFSIFPAVNEGKINKMCRNSEIFVKSTIFHNYKSLFCSKIMKKYEK